MFRRRDDAATLRLPYRRIRGNGSGSGGWSTTRVVVVTMCVVVVMLTAINLASFVAKKNTLKVTTSTASSISVTAKDVSFNGGGDTSRASAEAKAETGMNGFDEEQRMNDSKRSEGAGRNSGGDGIARLGTDSTSLVTNSTSVTMATNLTTTVTVAPPTPAPAMVVDPKRPVLASFVTGSMKEFLSNWAASAESVGLFNDIQVAAFDQGAVDACTEIKLNCVPIFEANGSSTTEFGGVATGGITLDGKKVFAKDTGAFMQIGVQKAVYLLQLLEKRPVLMSDVDVAFISDPFPYLEHLIGSVEFDLAVSNDCLSVHDDYANQEQGCVHAEFNTGILLWRPTARARSFVGEWRDAMVNPVSKWEHDQGAFNRIVKRNGLKRVGKRLVEATTELGPLRIFILPVDMFTGGHVFFVQRSPQKRGKTAFMVHTTYQFSHSLGKRERLREHMLWLHDDQAYFSEGNFVKVSSVLPAHLRAANTVEAHLEMSMHYRKSIRAAYAVAELLNRTVIMPELKCACDRWWGNILPSCIIPGSEGEMGLPFTCPMDHLFFLANFYEQKLDWREYSFLDNARTPAAVKSSRVRVGVDAAPKKAAQSTADGNSTVSTVAAADVQDDDNDNSIAHDVLLPSIADDRAIVDALGTFTNVRVLELDPAVTDAFCGFADIERNRNFNEKMNRALAASCHYCLTNANSDAPAHYQWIHGRDCAVGFDVPPPLTCSSS